jgi:RHS repeat-associated protein
VSYTYNNQTTLYSYDGDGRRVKKSNPDGSVLVMVYDAGGRLIAEYNSAATASTVYQPSYLTADSLGSTRVVTDASGVVKSRRDYLPFGEEIQAGIGGRTTAMKYSAVDGLRQRYTGHERDDESGLDFAQARYCSSATGRFTSPDSMMGTIRNPQTLNLYSYVANNPLVYIDPTGHSQTPPQMTLIFDASAAAAVEAGQGSYADYGIGPVITDEISIFADTQLEHIDAEPSSAISDFIRDTVIDPHKNDGDRMVEGLFVGYGKLAAAGASGPLLGALGALGEGAIAGEELASGGGELLESFGGGRVFAHFTDVEGATGITGVDAAGLEVGENTAVSELQFGYGQNSFLASEPGRIFVTELGPNATTGQLNQIGVFGAKQGFAIQFSEEAAFSQGARVFPEAASKSIYSIPGGTTLRGTFNLLRRF